MIKRICIVGSESTGKTTLAIDLARHYNTCWVPEYGRLYTEGRIYTKGHEDWETEEFVHIARIQNAMEDALFTVANRVLICDTDAFATAIWHEKYLGHESEEVKKLYRGRRYDLYIITDPTTPFTPDEIRVGEDSRHWMHERFVTALKKEGKGFIIVSGDREKRVRDAVRAIDKL